ncbi:hypothetical protein Csa_013892 [Cucumis sativus]|uniref:Uncharacterized protein n=1 Tax=Cucumis sativus TaxID=3659 RepID=A0A0A0LRE9_CUCSA|nr:hypothetical protein Csa_013892 [Cucumis sativus]
MSPCEVMIPFKLWLFSAGFEDATSDLWIFTSAEDLKILCSFLLRDQKVLMVKTITLFEVLHFDCCFNAAYSDF